MSNKNKIITIRHFSLLVLILTMYAVGIKDLLSASIGLIFIFAAIFVTIKLDTSNAIRDDLKIIDYFSFKHYIKE